MGSGTPLECSGPELGFEPRQELWAREGANEKWLQRVSGYYFARARLQTTSFAADRSGVSFTFYYDPDEPVCGESPRRQGEPNVNPEVICCRF